MDTQDSPTAAALESWPALPLDAWRDTYDTLHLWTQIVGKVRTALSAPTNHWWSSPLYVTARGLTTSPIPYGARTFEVGFDFIDHNLTIQTSDGGVKALALFPRSVADFYHEFMGALHALDIDVAINTLPRELADPIRFDEDTTHASYDAAQAHRFWRILVQADRLFKAFRARFIGKCSPVHFFWGSFDLTVTRFSGRRAPERPARRRRSTPTPRRSRQASRRQRLLLVTAVPFATALVARYLVTPAAPAACAVYAGGFAVVNVAFNLLWRSITQERRLLHPHVSQTRVDGLTRSFLLAFPVYLGATALAFVNAYASIEVCFCLWILWAITGYERTPRREPRSTEG